LRLAPPLQRSSSSDGIAMPATSKDTTRPAARANCRQVRSRDAGLLKAWPWQRSATQRHRRSSAISLDFASCPHAICAVAGRFDNDGAPHAAPARKIQDREAFQIIAISSRQVGQEFDKARASSTLCSVYQRLPCSRGRASAAQIGEAANEIEIASPALAS
jgi:hypothetical protein